MKNEIKEIHTALNIDCGLAVFLMLLIFGFSRVASAGNENALSQPCQYDSQMTYADMKEKALHDPQFLVAKTVAKDFEIDPAPMRFAIVKSTENYALPDINSRSFAGLRPGYRGQAVCRVKDFQGIWWFASREIDGGLSYVSSADAMPEKDYEESIRKRNFHEE